MNRPYTVRAVVLFKENAAYEAVTLVMVCNQLNYWPGFHLELILTPALTQMHWLNSRCSH